jgi:hypothetical protein
MKLQKVLLLSGQADCSQTAPAAQSQQVVPQGGKDASPDKSAPRKPRSPEEAAAAAVEERKQYQSAPAVIITKAMVEHGVHMFAVSALPGASRLGQGSVQQINVTFEGQTVGVAVRGCHQALLHELVVPCTAVHSQPLQSIKLLYQ